MGTALEKLVDENNKPGPLRSRPTLRELAYFGVVSLVLLLSLAIAPAKNYFSDWRHYQKAYLKIAGERQSGTLVRSFQGGIHQTWIAKLGVVDRCESCHVNMGGSLVGATSQPFRKHPPVPHDLDQFGCVMCHRGQGPATSVEEAHYTTEAWEQPLLPARFIESGCGQCHLSGVEGTPRLNEGRHMLSNQGCVHCHTVTQPDGTQLKPSDNPPPLTHIAEKTSREWIYAWIKDPQAYAASATMPNFQLSDADAADISAFLIAQSTASPAARVQLKPAVALGADAATEAATLYGASFCSSCHAIQNAAGNLVGGNLGPELTRVGNKVNGDWLRRWLNDPGNYHSDTLMPHYRLDEKQNALLASFLQSKKDPDYASNVKLAAANAESVARGKKLVTESGCAACHGINGVNPPQNFAPDLSRVGSRALAQVVFAPGMKHNLPDYLEGKIHDPRAFGPGLKMPKFTLADAQIDALTTALLAQTDRAATLPRELILSGTQPSNYHPGGDAGRLMDDLRCLSCHSINGKGGDMAPELTREGSAVQRAWLDEFLRNPNTLRPALIRRMPKFNLSQNEIKTLSDYILSAYQAPGIDSQTLDAHALSADAAARGKQLFYSKYGCQACHIADYKNDKGYVGPALSSVGNRLTPQWVYAWLKDPSALRPGTMMPNLNMKADEARDLTAFLMTLKAKQGGGK
ncbi:MAG TPA: c-type cytochrome [Candidatus Angelobacter sp.]|nr:c-type cytochrome [Candidatus Angelobacter sp.]